MSVSLGYVIYYVPDVARTINFYSSAFGLEVRFVTPEGDYGELVTGTTTLSFASDGLAHTNLDAAGGFTSVNATPAPIGASITLVTEDVPAAVVAATEAGAQVYVAPVDKPWGQTVAYVVDPDGILVELATPITSVPPVERDPLTGLGVIELGHPVTADDVADALDD